MLQNKKYNFRMRIAHLGMTQVRRALYFCVVPMIPLHMKLEIVVAETKGKQNLSKEMKEQISVIFT
jgi:hypothetical protein